MDTPSSTVSRGRDPMIRLFFACPRSGATLLMRIFARSSSCAVTSGLNLAGRTSSGDLSKSEYSIIDGLANHCVFAEAVASGKHFLISKEELNIDKEKYETMYDICSRLSAYTMVQPVILICDPIRVFHSWKSAGWEDIDSLIHCYISLFQALEQTSSHAASCLLYEKLVQNPRVEIQRICEKWQVPFSEAMLKNPLGSSYNFSADGEDAKFCDDEAVEPFATVEVNSSIAPEVATHSLLSNDEKDILEQSIGHRYLCCWEDDVVRLRTILSEKTWIGFDLDDTLHEFRRASSKATDYVITSISAQYGTPISRLREQYARILKAKTASAFADGRTSFDYRRERFNLLLKYFSLPQNAEFVDTLLKSYETALVGAHELKCGAVGLLSTMKRMGKKIAVITEGPQDGQERTVNALGIRKYIDVLATTNHFRVSKVDGLFRKVLQHLDISSDEIIYVGDSEERDMEPAIAEGIFSIHLAEAKDISLSSSPPRVNTLRKLQYIMSEKA